MLLNTTEIKAQSLISKRMTPDSTEISINVHYQQNILIFHREHEEAGMVSLVCPVF